MATWQHLRSSTANKRPTTSLADGRIAINTNTASPGLFFKDSAGTGIVKVGPAHVGTTAPNSVPASGGSSGNYLGEQWLDTSVSPAQMKVWNGSTWVGVVADELPVSKLQDGAARQLIQTDAAGTGVEWTSNVDVPGTLDVTSTATFDSIAQHPLGTAAAPTITFTGNTSTGIYSPGTDQVAISTGGTERARIDSSGRLLVGTSSARANISGFAVGTGASNIQQESTTEAGSSLALLLSRNAANEKPIITLGKGKTTTIGSNGVVASGDDLGAINFAGNDGTNFVPAAQILGEVDGTPGTNDMPGRLVFSTTADGASSPTERMRITNDGRVLIGHTSTASSATSSSLLTAGSSLITGAGWESYVTNTATRYHAVFSINGTAVGSITTASTSTAYNTSSDYRLKENILPVTDGITRLQQLKPCRFNFIDSPNATVDGFLAHEVQTIVPEAITGEKDAVDDEGNPQYQGIDQSKLVPLLTAALQEAIGEIESLKARLDAAGVPWAS